MRARWAWGIAAALALACATGPSDRELVANAAAQARSRCEADPATLRSPAKLAARGREALASHDWERAYCELALVRQLHPESAEARDVFPDAAKLFKAFYLRDRFVAPDAIWFTTEPEFLFAWLATFAGDAFPQAQADALLLGMPQPFGVALQRFAASRPELAAWRIALVDDDGILEEVHATRLAPHTAPQAAAQSR